MADFNPTVVPFARPDPELFRVYGFGAFQGWSWGANQSGQFLATAGFGLAGESSSPSGDPFGSSGDDSP